MTPADAVDTGEQLEIATAGEVGEQQRGLDHRADVRDDRAEIAAHVRAEHVQHTGGGAHETEQAPDGGGLSRPVGTEEAEHTPVGHREVESVDGNGHPAAQRAVLLAEPFDLDDRHLPPCLRPRGPRLPIGTIGENPPTRKATNGSLTPPMPADPDIVADVLVVGAGPAGVAAAITAQHRGLQTIVVDKATFPRDKTCGDALTASSVRLLARLGFDLDALPSYTTIPGTVIVSPDGTRVSSPMPADGRLVGVVPRLDLDAALVAHAKTRDVVVRERRRDLRARHDPGRGFAHGSLTARAHVRDG